jgi:hypothetical protein
MNIAAIVGIILLFILVIILIIFDITYHNKLKVCENEQSPYCYNLVCSTQNTQCNNYAARYDENGTLYCGYAPLQPQS